MAGGPGGTPRVDRGSAVGTVLVVSVATLLAACGSSEPTASGADLDRPAASSIDLVEFVDVAADVGLDVERSPFRWSVGPDPMAMMAGGLCWIDVDDDGWLDLFVTDTWSDGEWGRWRADDSIPTSRLFRNEVGRFVDVTETFGAGVENRSNGCVAADLDNDGWTDLYVTTERENVLLWNDGGDRFIDDAELPVASEADVYGWHSGAAVGDIDGNGWPDLYVAGYTDLGFPKTGTHPPGFPNPFVAEPDALLLNDGPSADGARVAFRDVTAEVGIEPNGPDYGLGAVLSDLDRDGDLDLYVANDFGRNNLYRNDGGRFTDVAAEAGVEDLSAGMSVAWGDYNRDGRMDLYVGNMFSSAGNRIAYQRQFRSGSDEESLQGFRRHARGNSLFENLGGGTFRDISVESGVTMGRWAWASPFLDLNNDGWLDLAVANGFITNSDSGDL